MLRLIKSNLKKDNKIQYYFSIAMCKSGDLVTVLEVETSEGWLPSEIIGSPYTKEHTMENIQMQNKIVETFGTMKEADDWFKYCSSNLPKDYSLSKTYKFQWMRDRKHILAAIKKLNKKRTYEINKP